MATERALLERERELGVVGAALEAAAAGRGGALAIEGMAGTGKTSLLVEARRLASDIGFGVSSGRATELEQDFPFAVVRQLFERRLVGLSTTERENLFEGAQAAQGALGTNTEQERSPDSFSVLHALYWVLAGLAEESPLLLAVDDAHIADPASLDWLNFLLPRLEELPVLLVLTSRPEEADDPTLVRILADSAVAHLPTAPLGLEASTTLTESFLAQKPDPAFAAACHQVTGGNPFLVTELARELADQEIEPRESQIGSMQRLAPEQVSKTVLARLSRLPPAAAELARALAILGEGSDPSLVLELAGLDRETGRQAADALRRAAVLEAGESLRFIHPLVRNAVYAELAPGERGAGHTTAAALLRERDALPEQIAVQLLASEPRGEEMAAVTLLEAGKRSLADGAPRSAVSYLTRALREPPPRELRMGVLRELLAAGIRAADQGALARIEPELKAEIERDPAATRDIAVQLPQGMTLSGRFAEAADVLQAAVRFAADEGDVESAFKMDSQLRAIGMVFPSAPEVDLQRYMDEVEPDSPAGRLAAAIEARSAVLDGSRDDAVAAAKHALGNDFNLFREEPEMVSATACVLVLLVADDLDTARQAANRALEIAREHNSAPEIGRGWLVRGIINWGYGDLVAAESDLRQARELADLAGIAPLALMCAGPLAVVLLERDELEAVEAILQETGTATGPIPPSGLFALLLLVRGMLHCERGRFAESAEDLENLSRQSQELGFGAGPAVTGSVHAVRALVATGQVEQASELAETLLEYARGWGAPGTIAHQLRAAAAAAGGAREIDLLEEAVAALTGSSWLLAHAHALVDLGAALRRQNQRAAAREPLREGLKRARQCGAVRLAKRAHHELRATGETVRRYAPIGVESLTPSERRVSELAASGMTNRQIAQSLFVTLKTVEAHLSAAYDKLDISSRRQLQGALNADSERFD